MCSAKVRSVHILLIVLKSGIKSIAKACNPCPNIAQSFGGGAYPALGRRPPKGMRARKKVADSADDVETHSSLPEGC